MISYAEAIQILQREIAPLAGTSSGPNDWHRGVTANAVDSPSAVPPFANSAMDGFALRSADTYGATADNPSELKVWGTVAAGDPPLSDASPSGAAEIMTGAVIPINCDAVMPVERVTVIKEDGATKVRIDEPVAPGLNVRVAGEDFMPGATVVNATTLIEPHHVMALAATGVRSVEVRRKPRVAVITTGAELTDSHDTAPARPGMIENANGPYLRAVLERIGAELVSNQQASDKEEDIADAITRSADAADLVITTGAVSAGRYDLIPSIIESAGGDVLLHKVRVRPGKPVLCARLASGKLLIGLPGNPIAAAVCVRFIAIPAIRMLRGLPAEKFHAAVTTSRINKRSEFYFFGKAHAIVNTTGTIQVELLPGQESFKISPLTVANCWAVVPEGTDEIAAGDLIEVAPLYPDNYLQ